MCSLLNDISVLLTSPQHFPTLLLFRVGRTARVVKTRLCCQLVELYNTCSSLYDHKHRRNLANITVEEGKGGKVTMCITYVNSGFGGIEVECWPLVPKFAGSNPAVAVGFLRVNKNPQHVGGHECLSVVIVVCCQVEVSATN